MYKYELTAEMIYGLPVPVCPQGFEIIGFRPPLFGEHYISSDYHHTVDVAHIDFGPQAPRLILLKAKTTKIIFTKIGHRVPKKREWVGGKDDTVFLLGSAILTSTYDIYTREVVEE